MAVLPMRASVLLVVSMSIVVSVRGDSDSARTVSLPTLPPLPKCPRPGLCPQIRRLPVTKAQVEIETEGKGSVEPPSLCGNLCTNDDVCPHGKKCCPTTCGYACYDPVFVVE